MAPLPRPSRVGEEGQGLIGRAAINYAGGRARGLAGDFFGRVKLDAGLRSFKIIRALFTLTILGFCTTAAHAGRPADVGDADLSSGVRSILSNNCFQCHGPDDAERQADLRLDDAGGALVELPSGARAIVPGEPEASELVLRIRASDDDVRMPPPEMGKRLSHREIDLLTEWIRQGAEFPQHWSYRPLRRPAVPAVDSAGPNSDGPDSDWPSNQIDHFVLRRLQQAGMAPAPEVQRAALARRLSLDLTGLPPTWEEVKQFVDDNEPGAVTRRVDHLLAQPSYGEHWARMWLDLARYADSAGYADDPPRTIWAYRDWVIRALNDNMPFDQFTIEQLAGDLLPEPTQEQLVATAFHRNTLTNSEGGTDDEEFRNVAIVDRVNTTMTVWMGTTAACAQCHNHKFDPISQDEYFELFAIFNNTEDHDQRDERPLLELWTEQQQEQQQALRPEIARLERELASLTTAARESQMQWEQKWQSAPTARAIVPAKWSSRSGAAMTLLDDGSIRVAKGGATDVYSLQFVVGRDATVAVVQLETLPDESLPENGPGHGAGNFVITNIEVLANEPIQFVEAYADFSQTEFAASGVIDAGQPGSGWAVGGQLGRAHTLSLVLEQPLDLSAGSTFKIKIAQESTHQHHTLGRFRLALASDPLMAQYVRLPTSIIQILGVAPPERSEQQASDLANYYLSVFPKTAEIHARLTRAKTELAALTPETTVPIARELVDVKRRKTHIQLRGNFLNLGKEVAPALPTMLHSPALFQSSAEEGPPNRLTLARWLVDGRNPLTARVIANRYWESLFGVGLVQTSEDFGSQGEAPSHPQLLDWLASELVRLDWDAKAFLRLLVTSSTYRQSAAVTAEQFENDPDNRLLARGPRFRLSAEMIRDQALSVGGLLSPRMYGPPVRPPQPALGLSAAFGSGVDWTASDGEDRYRRGMYTTWRRSSPYPSMSTFDAPNREVCTVRRARTNTPLQALVTLNDPVYVEAAQALARRMMAAAETTIEQARYGFRQCVSREPSEQEVDHLVQLFDVARERLAQPPGGAEPIEALQLATAPLGPLPAGADPVEAAAWTVVANVLLNLDEMMLKR
ncbi:PSD1 and planctomycete cytochrome C domain-containing protein [Pirellulales bacterium]|nr:PSD1 and planctomycete cytochrome C domain-containing protein [Pirellulales bacterium]